MLFLAVILLGLISYQRLPIDLLPDVSYPRLVVYTSYPDVAPAEVERLITERIEAESAAVPGVERVTSVSREGVSRGRPGGLGGQVVTPERKCPALGRPRRVDRAPVVPEDARQVGAVGER